MEDHIPIRPDRSLLFSRQTFKWSLWDVVFHENNSTFETNLVFAPWKDESFSKISENERWQGVSTIYFYETPINKADLNEDF